MNVNVFATTAVLAWNELNAQLIKLRAVGQIKAPPSFFDLKF